MDFINNLESFSLAQSFQSLSKPQMDLAMLLDVGDNWTSLSSNQAQG